MIRPKKYEQRLFGICQPFEIEKEMAERHFRQFARQAWPVVEPATAFTANWHFDALADHRRRMLAEGKDVKAGPVFVDTRGGFLRKSNFQRTCPF